MASGKDTAADRSSGLFRFPRLASRITRVFPWLLVVGVLLVLGLRQRAVEPLPAPQDARRVEREFVALGTLTSVTLYLDDPAQSAHADSALHDLERWLAGFERRWSAWGAGELGRINRDLAAGKTVAIPDEMRPLFERSMALTRLSGGLFDPRIGRLVKLWGFDDEAHYRTEPPSSAEIAAWRESFRSPPDALSPCPPAASRSPSSVCYGPAPQVAWDFGGIAKGYAVGLAVERLRRAGLRNVIVNAGGNLMTAGRRGERAWRIGIRHPRGGDAQRVLASLETSGDEAVMTSGDYERYFESGGRRYHHILDPATGEPARGFQAVTVVHPDPTLADAASKIFVAGPGRWREVAAALGISQALVVDDQGRVHVTPALAPRLRFEPDVSYEVVP